MSEESPIESRLEREIRDVAADPEKFPPLWVIFSLTGAAVIFALLVWGLVRLLVH